MSADDREALNGRPLALAAHVVCRRLDPEQRGLKPQVIEEALIADQARISAKIQGQRSTARSTTTKTCSKAGQTTRGSGKTSRATTQGGAVGSGLGGGGIPDHVTSRHGQSRNALREHPRGAACGRSRDTGWQSWQHAIHSPAELGPVRVDLVWDVPGEAVGIYAKA